MRGACGVAVVTTPLRLLLPLPPPSSWLLLLLLPLACWLRAGAGRPRRGGARASSPAPAGAAAHPHMSHFPVVLRRGRSAGSGPSSARHPFPSPALLPPTRPLPLVLAAWLRASAPCYSTSSGSACYSRERSCD